MIAHKLGCSWYDALQPYGPATPWTKQDATCTLWPGRTNVEIATFANQSNEDAWASAGGSGVEVTGHLWAVLVNNETQASRVVALLGGTAH